MASFSAQVRNWSEKAKRSADLVCRASIQDVAELASVAKDGLVRGAPFETGIVPVDQGQLIGSLSVQINGAVTGQGDAGAGSPPDYAASLVGFELGDTVQVAYSAPYSRVIEYGRGSTPGRFFVRGAVQSWPQVVAANADLFKD